MYVCVFVRDEFVHSHVDSCFLLFGKQFTIQEEAVVIATVS